MKKLKSLEYNTMMWFIIRAGFTEFTLAAIIKFVGQDSWISILLGIIVGFFPLCIYEYLRNKYPDDNYISLTKKLFKKFDFLLNFLLFMGCIIVSICTFWVLVHFANSLFLYRTSSFIISAILIIPIGYAVTKGIHIISKISLILFYISVLFNIIIMIGITGGIDLNNLKPLFESGQNKILYSSFIFIAFSISKIFFLSVIPKKKIINYSAKANFLTYLITCLNILNIAVSTICIFGVDLASLYEYPGFQVLKRVNILGVIDRAESILSIEGMFSIFIEMNVIIYYSVQLIKNTFNLKQKTDKYMIILVCLITVVVSNLIFKNHELGEKIFSNYLVYIMLFLLIILPFIVFLKSLYNTKFVKSKDNCSAYQRYDE